MDKKAKELFKNHNCCQSVIMACSRMVNFNPDQAAKIGAGFGAGMGFQGRTCGAVVGAYMALGLKVGEQTSNPEELKEKTHQLTQHYNKRFTERFGSTICRDLLNVDLSIPEGMDEANSKGLFDSQCPLYVQASVEIVEELFNKFELNNNH